MRKSKYSKTLKVFNCRKDVYARAYKKEDGSIGFSPVCKNEGKPDVCKKPCAGCRHRQYRCLDDEAVRQHIEGEILLGVYPLQPDKTTSFLVIDFDNHTGEKAEKIDPFSDANAYVDSAKDLGIFAYIERSKSGKGYHVWMFFEHPILASKARQIGNLILARSGISKTHSSFCRFFPNQDHLSGKMLGNLIAVPFWGKAVEKGNSVFLNPKDKMRPYKKRTDFYKTIIFIKEAMVDNIIAKNKLSTCGVQAVEGKLEPPKGTDNWIMEAMQGVLRGKRNDTAARLAGHFLAKRLPLGEVKVLLYDWNKRNSPPLEESEINRIVESINSMELAKSKGKDEFFDHKNKFIPMNLVDHIIKSYDILHDGSGFYLYRPDGVWHHEKDFGIGQMMVKLLGNRAQRHFVQNAMDILRYQTYVDLEKVGRNPLLINMRTGMLDLLTMELLPHDKKYYSQYQMPIAYDPEAKCPRWRQFLVEVFPDDPKKIKTVRDFSGYCFYPNIHIHKCLLLTGKGGNGKSVFVNIITRLVGEDNVASLQPTNLTDKFLLGTLKDKLLNVSSEIQGNKIENSVWRQVIAGDTVQADRKFNKPISFRPIAKHIYSMNMTPIITDRSNAFVRRIIVVEFKAVFDEMSADKELEDKLTKELPGIFNWALKGFRRVVLENKNIRESLQVKKDKKTFLKAVDPVLNFVEDRCILRDSKSIRKLDLYSEFVDWCHTNRIKPLTDRTFYKQLLINHPELTEKRPGGKERTFVGIGLK
ncbi:MAG: phage/plasmid primase, P4 family [Deltaproteobacteria bacterium]|nr:phage/plasmid primase, P4 family [Deltaproteobacteria bacterium]